MSDRPAFQDNHVSGCHWLRQCRRTSGGLTSCWCFLPSLRLGTGKASGTLRVNQWIAGALALAVACSAAPLEGAIVLLKSGQQIKGFLIRQNAAEVVVGIPQPDGRREEKRFARGEVDDVILTVAVDRLEKLDPAKPTDYRDYAEELAEKREDPEARETALRLYLIAASLDQAKLGRSSLLAMAALARTPAEAKTFRAMSFLLDPAHDRRLLESPAAAPDNPLPKPAAGNAAARDFLKLALRAFRQGKPTEAVAHLKRPGVAAEFEAISKGYPYDDFLKACQAAVKNHVPPSILVRTLEMEVALGEPSEKPVAPSAGSPGSTSATWSAVISSGALAPVRPLELESITEFDPAANRFRGGKWVAE